jgi:hypothetical protein
VRHLSALAKRYDVQALKPFAPYKRHAMLANKADYKLTQLQDFSRESTCNALFPVTCHRLPVTFV